MKIFQETIRPTSSPWGSVDSAQMLAPGIWLVSTPGHGGYHLSAERRACMPAHLRDCVTYAGGNWYEEDCDWILLALAWPELFKAEHVAYARKYLLGHDRTEEHYPGETVGRYFETWREAARAIKFAESQGELLGVAS